MRESGQSEEDRDGAAPPSSRAAILRVVVPYVIFAGLWILLSDRLLGSALHDARAQMYWSMAKGLLFVLVTALLLSVLLARELRARASAEALRRRAEAERQELADRHAGEITALNERLMTAQEQERTRIAGELHDSVMQRIAALSLALGTARRAIPTGPAADAMVRDVQRQLIDVGTEIRQISHDLHPPILQAAGLPEALRGYCVEFGEARAVSISCDADDSLADLSPGASLALYRVGQEALGNAVKHAAARCIDVRLSRVAGDVVLSVSDDGVGCDPGQLAHGGLGLVSMRERARQLGGTFEWDSRPGRGTTVRVAIPFRARGANPLPAAEVESA